MKINLYFFKRRIKTGNILATNSISIFKIGKLLPENFTVDFDFDKTTPTVTFTPRLTNNSSIYHDIYYKVSNGDLEKIISVEDGGKVPTDWKKISNNSNYTIFSLNDNVNFTLNFEIRSKIDDNVVLNKTFDINLRANGFVSDGMGNTSGESSGISGGTINGENDPTLGPSGSYFNGINEKSSFSDIIASVKETFSLFALIFSAVPSFIWVLVTTGLVVCIALRILGR